MALCIIAGDRAPFHYELAAFRNDVEDGTALDRADMNGGVRRVEAILKRAFRRQPARFRCDVGHRLAGGLYGVHALAWFAGMTGQTTHPHAKVKLALVRQ